METIDIGCNKVDIINNPELEEDIGYLVILSAYHNGVDSFTINNATYSVKSELSDDSTLHDSQIEYISEYINECYDAVKSGEFETVDRLIDIDSLVDYYILQEYVMNNDLGWDSFYMYKNRGGKLFFGPGWDFDLTFGLDWSGGEYDKIYAASSEPRATSLNYWFYTAMEAQWFRKLVRDRFNEIETERKAMLDEIDRVYAKYSNSFENEWARWGARQDSFSWMFVGEYNSLNERIELLKIWLSGRDKYLDEIYNSERFIVDGLCEEDFYGSSKAQ